MLIAHLGPYGLTAFGGYGQFTGPDGGKYTALFVIAGITAPIGGPPAFFATGLGGGAGVNRQLVLPANLDDFPSYPLVAAIDPHSTLASDPGKGARRAVRRISARARELLVRRRRELHQLRARRRHGRYRGIGRRRIPGRAALGTWPDGAAQ